MIHMFYSQTSVLVMHDHPHHGSTIMGGMFGMRKPFQPKKEIFENILHVKYVFGFHLKTLRLFF